MTAKSARESGQERWAVVGAGMLGLTLALRLSQQGKAVTVIEAADRVGGLATAWKVGDIVWDRHYHVTLLSDVHLRSLLAELGLDEELEWRFTRTGCFAAGELYSVSNTLELLRFPVLRMIDKLRLGLTILYASRVRNGLRFEKVLVGDWLRRWSGDRAFDRFWLPLLRSKLGDAYQETSAAFIWATIARLYAARRSGLKREMFGYLPGGYARTLERFAQVLVQAGVEIDLGRPVDSIEPADGDLAVVCRDGGRRRFERVVVTAAAPVVPRLCPHLDDAERARLESVRYLGIVCASVLLSRPLGGYYVTNILDDSFPFTGVIEMSALVDPDQFGGKSLVYLPRYLASDDPFFEENDQDIQDRFLEALARMFPNLRPDEVLAFRISRARHVLPLSTLDYSANLVPIETSVPGLYVANSAQIVNGTLNVNETVQLAEAAASEFA